MGGSHGHERTEFQSDAGREERSDLRTRAVALGARVVGRPPCLSRFTHRLDGGRLRPGREALVFSKNSKDGEPARECLAGKRALRLGTMFAESQTRSPPAARVCHDAGTGTHASGQLATLG